ncbi:kinase-like domain-containing protein [Blyttiomyces helicus]|uniref:non-specific serine/threonine protein kinase n=1 Tax=Blyttiomyces helicus TaxID=388810 RepID=A0A4P9W5H7_9FUNG|nr:kinase-like domain-containing protein [Blyttiomyces helicus]|eukprot:RKO87659.1 kinase-like domain-containing protein [Blyttiomyces helicus]
MEEATLIKQGAEARVYKMPFGPLTAIVKERFPKSYRHPTLDERLTARRTIQEARSLQRLRRAGVDAPAVYLLDLKQALIYMEFVEGRSVRDFLVAGEGDAEKVKELARAIGHSLALMHGLDIVHGDLTTSNMLLRAGSDSLVSRLDCVA